MKKKIVGLMVVIIVVFFVSVIVFIKNHQIETVKSGTYVVYSTVKNISDTESPVFENRLFSYRLEDGIVTKLFSEKDPEVLPFEKRGKKIFAGLLSIDMGGALISAEFDLENTVWSNNGEFKAVTEVLKKVSEENSPTCDGLVVNIFGSNDEEAVRNKIFIWKQFGLKQLCLENHYLSNDGKYFYAIGDSTGAGVNDIIIKYSFDEDKMTKIEVGKNSWLGSWQLYADNGWLIGVTYGYNYESSEVIRISLSSGEITYLTEENPGIGKAFLSVDGNRWSPVLNDDAENVIDCVRVLSIDEALANDDSQCLTEGKVIDWFDDILVVDSDGELSLFDLTTEMIIVLGGVTDENWQSNIQAVEYIGIIKIN